MKKITEVIIFMTMILAGIAWILGFDIIYSISATIMGIAGIYYWFRYMIPELFNSNEEREFIDD